VTFSHNGRRFKASVDSFAKTPVRTKTEAVKMWLPKFVTAVMENRYPQTEAVMSPPIASSTASEFLKEYRKRHCEAEKLNMDSLSWELNVIDRRFGAFPLSALEKPGPIKDFKAGMVGAGKTWHAELSHQVVSPGSRSQNPLISLVGPPGIEPGTP
jgi:hypothetical protein